MKRLDALITALSSVVKDYVESRMAAREAQFAAKLAEIEARELIPGKDGRDGIDGKDGRDGIDGKDGAPGPQGEPGPAGEIGPAGPQGEKGDPGVPGERGEKGDPGERGADGRDGRDGPRGERGEKGDPGLDGKDGLGFDDLTFEYDGERSAVLRFIRGEIVKEFPFTVPAVLYRGVYTDARAYEKGDVVTWGGSAWICKETTDTKPGDGSKDWQLMVKKGRDLR